MIRSKWDSERWRYGRSALLRKLPQPARHPAQLTTSPHQTAAPLHSPLFRTPLLQMVDPQLDALAHTLLKQLRQLDGMERAGAIATAATLAPLLPAERALAATGLQLPTLNPVLGAVTVTAPAVAADPAFPALPDTLLGASKPVRRLVGGLREVRAAGYVQVDPNSAPVQQLLYSWLCSAAVSPHTT